MTDLEIMTIVLGVALITALGVFDRLTLGQSGLSTFS
jgi:hypothetical protein